MIPIQLKIKGLYSYVEEQEIDFNRLSEAGLFGIFGKMGSGKSTILEAMAFALYEDTERFLSRGDNRNYNMLNLNSNEGRIDFTFKAGKLNQVYRIVAELKRKARDFENVTFDIKHYKVEETGTFTPIKGSDINEVVGISYKNFKRTVIIPQGQFKEFLELSQKDRTTMLKELFSLERFDLGARVSALERENNSSIDKLSGELNAVAHVSEQLIVEKDHELLLKEKDLAKQNKELAANKEQLAEHKKLEADITAYGNKKTLFEAKQIAVKNIAEQEKIVNEYEKVFRLFDALIKKSAELEKECVIRKLDLEKTTTLQTKANEAVEISKVSLKNSENEVSKKPSYEQLIGQLEALMQITEVKTKIKETEEKKAGLEKKYAVEFTQRMEFGKQKIQSIERELEDLNPVLNQEEYLEKVQAWVLSYDQLKEKQQELMAESHTLTEGLHAKRQLINTEIGKKLKQELNTLTENFTYAQFENTLLELKRGLSNEQAQIEQQKKIMDVKLHLQAYASDLADGKACALCGSEHHPAPLEQKDYSSELGQLELAIQAIETKKKELDQLDKTINKFFTGLAIDEERLAKVVSTLSNYEQQIKKQEAEFPAGQFVLATIADFKAAKEELNRAKKKQKDLLVTQKQSRELLEQLKVNATTTEETIKSLESEIIANKGQLELLNPRVVGFDQGPYANYTRVAFEKDLKKLKDSIVNNAAKYEKAQQALKEAEVTLATLTEKAKGQQQELAHTQEQLQRVSQELKDQLLDNDYQLEQVKEILAQEIDAEKVRQIAKRLGEELATLKAELAALNEKIKDKVFDKAKLDELERVTLALDKQVVETTKAVGAIKNEIEGLKASLVKKQALETLLAAKTIRKTNISTLKSLFNGSGFVNFASMRYLQNVVNLANVRFAKMSRQKFKMELDKEGTFMVRDNCNGGKLRLLKSLSGGQTFQAALSLALALSENIQQSAGMDQQFFFLDEGFGTLDKESLAEVFDTLKSLQKERRIVGLISHVEELQQELDVYLQIEQNGDQGSRVKGSWEKVG